MEFAAIQQTDSTVSKTNLTFKIYNDKIYYLWNERDIDNVAQIWFAESNLNGSEFVVMPLTSDTFSANKPELYIYNDKIYIAFYAIAEETGLYQIWIASMDLDCKSFTILHTTSYIAGARKPTIVVKNDVIHLAYEMGNYDGTSYHHMVRAKLNIDGTEFYESAASYSVNEIVKDVQVFVTDDPSDNKVYYMWTRNYFIGDPPAVYLYSADNDALNFTMIIGINKAVAKSLYVKNNKIYFTYISYVDNQSKCSVINTDGSNLENLLSSSTNNHALMHIDTDANNDTIINLTIQNIIASSFPTRTFEIILATLNVNTFEYSETNLVTDIVGSFNDKLNLHYIKDNDEQYFTWQQYDENNIYQIYTGILAEELLCVGVECSDFCDFETHIKYVNGTCDPETGECLYDEEINSIECGYVSPDEPEATAFPWWTLGLLLLFQNNENGK